MNANKQATGIFDISLRTAALTAGFGSIFTALVAGFSFGFVRTSLIIPGDATATVNNIMASGILFRAGIFGWLIIIILDILVAWSLYVFFRPVNRSVSLLAGWLGLAAATISGIAQLNIIIVLSLLSGANYLKVFEPAQLYALSLLFLNAFDKIWAIGLFVFGCHLFFRGFLAFRSGFIPRIFGVLLLIASLCYLVSTSANILLPNYENYKATVDMIISGPLAIGELSLAFWLIFRGGKIQKEG
ncbi:MAG: DUF4386 domain-containing protein [Candidatus Saccharimonadaceae bacterium]